MANYKPWHFLPFGILASIPLIVWLATTLDDPDIGVPASLGFAAFYVLAMVTAGVLTATGVFSDRDDHHDSGGVGPV